jgi:hypothetical protein
MVRSDRRRIQLRSNALLVAILLASGCAMLRRPEPVVDRTGDPRIRSEIEARLAGEPALTGSEIRVEVDGGIVVLHGSVRGIGAWQCAIRTAQLVEGVRSVSDFLMIERGERDVTCRTGSRFTLRDGALPAAPWYATRAGPLP